MKICLSLAINRNPLQQLIHHIETRESFELANNVNHQPGKSDYPNWGNALSFCQQWINGHQQFSISTSGSTGVPKAIQLERKQMQASAKKTIKALQLPTGSNFLVCLNTEFIGGKMMLVRGLEYNMNLYLAEPSSNPFIGIDDTLHLDFAAMVPLQIQTIIEEGGKALTKLNSMKALIIGGAPVSYSLLQEIEKLKVPIYATYGMTETVSHIALKKLNGVNRSDYFQLLDGIEIKLDNRGCLIIKGDVTNNQTIITNDIIDLVDQKHFRWLGRADNIINTGGVKVHPEQVENQIEKVFNKLELTNRFFIAGQPDEKLGQKVTLFIEGEMFNSVIIKENMNEVLSKYECPKEIHFVLKFAETGSGKLNRKETTHLPKI